MSCTLFAYWDLCSGNQAARIGQLARVLCENGAMDEDVWLSTAEWELLEESQTVRSVADDKRREVRFYTRVVYVQTRFNLITECPIGFSRLCSVLHRVMVDPVDKIRTDLCRLVGALKIEPHRVLDALLEFLPPHPHDSHHLLDLFDKGKASHIMGRKFQVPKKVESAEAADVDKRADKLQRTTRLGRGEDLRLAKDATQSGGTSRRISTYYFRLCATLEVEGYLDMGIVFAYLSPSLDETRSKAAEFSQSVREAAREQRFPNLNRPLTESRSRMTEKDRNLHAVDRDPKKFWYQPEKVVGLEEGAQTHDDAFPRMAAAFLETSKPGKGLRILKALGEVYCKDITEGCLSVVERILDPLVKKFPSKSIDHFLEEVKAPLFPALAKSASAVFDWLGVAGYRLHLRLDLLQKAVLVMMHELKFYGHADYSKDALFGYPAPKRHSVEYMLSTVFLPALLMTDLKRGLRAAAWIEMLIKLCSYSVRVMVFIHFGEFVSKSAILDRAVAMAEAVARNLIKILVTAQDNKAFETNVIPIVDALSKIAIRAPFQVTDVMIRKVQTDVMAAKDLSTAMLFFTPLSFSAFAHHFVLEVISGGTSRKHDDAHISQWYKNMLTLLGHAAHDYPDMLPLHFILQNIMKEVAGTEVIHVHILKELVHSMTGFQHCSEIGNSQFATLSGGPMLKSIGLVTPWQKDESGYNASATALKKTLSMFPRNKEEGHEEIQLTLGGQMFVLLIKFLDYIPIRGDFAKVTSIQEMHSTVLGTFLAFVEFLSVYSTAQEYSQMLPPIGYVLNKLKLPMHYVAHLYRPSIAEFRVVQGLPKKEPKPNDTRLLFILKELTQSVEESMDETDIAKLLDRSGLSSVDPYLYQKYGLIYSRSFYDFVDDLSQSEQFIEKGYWEVMSPEFYAFFWSLRLNDITISDTEYRRQITQIESEIQEQEHEAAKNQLQYKLSLLNTERDLQQAHVKFCRDFIRSRQSHLLSHIPTEKLRSFVDAFVQICLYPRIRLGHEDALFAFEFIVIMTKLGVKNFPTLFILDKVVKELFPCLICMTDNEAEGFANFMYEFLRQMERMRSNTAQFMKEFGSLPGALEDPYTAGSTALVTHPNFLKVMAKWSNVIARLLKECLQPQVIYSTRLNIHGLFFVKESDQSVGNGSEVDPVKHRSIMRRPALLMLDRLIPIFPTLTGLAKHLRAALQYVKDHDQDEGIKTSAFTALSRLNAEMASTKPGRWLELEAYNISQKDPAPETTEIAQIRMEDVMEIEKDDQEAVKEDGTGTEEGEVEKSTMKRARQRKSPPEETQHRSKKRTISKSDSASEPMSTDGSRRPSDGRKKRETSSDMHRSKSTSRRDDSRRKN